MKAPVHPGIKHGTSTGFLFAVPKPSPTRRTDQRDCTGGNKMHLRAWNEQSFCRGCGRRTSECRLDWFWVSERRTEERILLLHRKCAYWYSTQRGTKQHTRPKHREIGSTLFFHGCVHRQSTSLYSHCTPSSKSLSVKKSTNKPSKLKKSKP